MRARTLVWPAVVSIRLTIRFESGKFISANGRSGDGTGLGGVRTRFTIKAKSAGFPLISGNATVTDLVLQRWFRGLGAGVGSVSHNVNGSAVIMRFGRKDVGVRLVAATNILFNSKAINGIGIVSTAAARL